VLKRDIKLNQPTNQPGAPIVKYRDTLWSSVQKRPNRSSCRLGCGLVWVQGIMCWMGVQQCWGTLPWQPVWD